MFDGCFQPEHHSLAIIQATSGKHCSIVFAVGSLVGRRAIEQLAQQAVSEELVVLLATTDVQAGVPLVTGMKPGAHLHI